MNGRVGVRRPYPPPYRHGMGCRAMAIWAEPAPKEGPSTTQIPHKAAIASEDTSKDGFIPPGIFGVFFSGAAFPAKGLSPRLRLTPHGARSSPLVHGSRQKTWVCVFRQAGLSPWFRRPHDEGVPWARHALHTVPT